MTERAKLWKLKSSETAVVDYVAAIGTGAKEPLQKVGILCEINECDFIWNKWIR